MERAGDAIAQYDPRFAPQRDDPFSYYRWARRERPVLYAETVDAWLVTRYDDIRTVLNDPVTYSSRIAVPTPADNAAEAVVSVLREGLPQGRVIINEDPPGHDELRRIAAGALSPRRVRSLRPRFRELADELIDGFVGDGAVELVWGFCDPLSWASVQTLIGIPRPDQRQARDWNDDMMTLSLPFPSVEEKRVAASGFVAYQRYIAELAERRRADPQDDVVSDLAGMDLPPEDLVALVWSLSTGKNSLRDALGTCMLTLLSQREHWERACAEPRAIPSMFEETLRRDAPLRGLFRVTTADVELGGVSLPQGSRLYVLYASGNRDETRFPEPDAFDPDRDRLGAHLGFGEGSHRCLGAPLARAAGSIGVTALAERIPDLRLDEDDPTFLDKYFFHGPSRLRARW